MMYPGCLLATLLLVAIVVVAAEKPVVHFCHVASFDNETSTISILTGFLAVEELSPQYPNVDFRHHLIARNRNKNVREVVYAMLNSEFECDMYLGPRTSQYSIAAGPIVERPWISDTASSTELSDKTNYYYFSRMIPTDEVGGAAMAEMLKHFEWDSVATFCADESYGRSLATGFTASVRSNGGQVTMASCLHTDASYEEVLSVLHGFQDQPSRIVALCMAGGSTLAKNVNRAIKTEGMFNDFVFIYSESSCSDGTQMPLGSLCISYVTEPKFSILERLFAADNSKYSFISREPYGMVLVPTEIEAVVYNALTFDMFNFSMSAIHESYAVNPSLLDARPRSKADLLQVIRGHSIEGMSGPVALDEKGNRLGAKMRMFNVQPSGKQPFGGWNSIDGTHVFADKLYWLDYGFGPVPVATIDKGVEEAEIPTILIVGVFFCCLVFGFCILIIFKLKSMSKSGMRAMLDNMLWVDPLKVIIHAVDIMTDLISCYIVVFTREATLTFKIFFALITVVAFIASVIDMMQLLRHFVATMSSGGELDPIVEMEWTERIANAAVVSLILEDLPMLILTFIATLQESELFLTISLIFSAVLFGTKLRMIPKVLSRREQSEDNEDPEEMTMSDDEDKDGSLVTFKEHTQNPTDDVEVIDITSTASDTSPQTKSLNPLSPGHDTDHGHERTFAEKLKETNEDRYVKLQHLARNTMVQLIANPNCVKEREYTDIVDPEIRSAFISMGARRASGALAPRQLSKWKNVKMKIQKLQTDSEEKS